MPIAGAVTREDEGWEWEVGNEREKGKEEGERVMEEGIDTNRLREIGEKKKKDREREKE